MPWPLSSNPRKRQVSISRQIVFLLLGFTVIPMVALTGLFYLFTASMYRGEADRIQNEVAERVSQSVSLHVEKSQASLRLLSFSVDLEMPDFPKEHRTLSNFLFHEREFDEIALARPDGHLTVRLSRFHTYGEDDTESVGAEEGFQRALHGQAGIGDVKASSFSRFPLLRLYVPLMGQLDRVTGVICADMNISRLWRLVSKSFTGKDIDAYIVDRTGVLIAFEDLSAVLDRKNLQDVSGVKRFLSGVRNGSAYVGIRGTRVVGVVREAALTRWGVVVETPVQDAYRHLNALWGILGALALCMSLLATLFGWRFSARHILYPIRTLQKDVRIMATGDLLHQITHRTEDELGRLAADISSMVENLRATTVSRESLIRENSERRKSEDALQQSEDKMKSIFRAAPVGIGVVIDRVLMDVNSRLCEMTEYGREELIGNSARLFYPTPEEFEYVGKEKYRQISERGTGTVETRWRRKNGAIMEVLLSSTPIDSSNLSAGVTFTALDITSRKQAEAALRDSEERLRILFNGINDAVFVHEGPENGNPGRFIEVNDPACVRLGYSRSELLTMRPMDIDAPETVPNVPKMMERLYANGYAVWEGIHVRKDGTRIPVEIGNHLAHLEGRQVIISTVRDISERMWAEDEKEKLRAQLLQAQKMEAVGRLAGGVAHDFNNMLQSILGYAEMTLNEMGTENLLRKNLLEIQSAATRSADLTGQLLAFARKQTVSPQVLNLNDALSGMLRMLGRLIGEDIDLVWMPGHGLWRVRIDPTQVDQILANLAVNARDAISGVGKVTIQTQNRVLDAADSAGHPECVPGEYVLLTVTDTGCGMNSETLAHIFEPFFTTKGLGLGTGLGLATVYGIVRQNNGFVSVFSKPGQGARFEIYLPRFETDPDPDHVSANSESRVLPEGTETVLLVEDNETILDLGKMMLERLGYTVLAAATTKDALRLAGDSSGNIDILITDVVMPEMNGRELVERLLAIQPGLKCLFMSGYTADVIANRGILDQGVNFIQKPFSVMELAVKVRDALSR
jgi:PAS domain S-box-containing protein